MLEVLKFMFQSFWHFIGSIILLGIVTETIVRLFRGYPPCEEKDDEEEN